MSTNAWKKLGKGEWKNWFGVMGRILLAYALVFSQSAWGAQRRQAKDKPAGSQKVAAAQNAATTPQKASAAAPTKASGETEESESAVVEKKGPDEARHQTVRVHGHWTVEVRDPDGSVVTHREFENAYQPGYNTLPDLVSRTVIPGSWAIGFDGSGCISNPTTCDISEGGVPARSTNLSVKELSVTGGAHILLSGSVQPVVTQITSVWTFLGECNPFFVSSESACVSSVPSGTDSSQFLAAFSMKDLTASPIPVAVGQTVQVTVDISFS